MFIGFRLHAGCSNGYGADMRERAICYQQSVVYMCVITQGQSSPFIWHPVPSSNFYIFVFAYIILYTYSYTNTYITHKH